MAPPWQWSNKRGSSHPPASIRPLRDTTSAQPPVWNNLSSLLMAGLNILDLNPRHFRPPSHPLYRQLPTLMSSTASTGTSGAAPSTSPPTATGRSSPVNPRHRRRRSMGTSLAPSTSSAWCVDSCGVYGNGLLVEDFVAKWGRPYFDVNKQQQGSHGRRSRRQFSKAIAIAEMAGMGRRAPQAVLPTM